MMMATFSAADDFTLTLRHQVETAPGSGQYRSVDRQESWNARETAVIICDVWDLHHSQNAVRRLEEFAPRLDQVLKEARRQGATIIHSPSDCMDAYTEHPARHRAIATPLAAQLPDDIKSWCSRIPAEEQVVYPLDQSDGGDDDDPEEHKLWAAKLEQLGRNPGLPWQKQSHLITIDSERDFISDRGDEVWSILQQHGIKNVILTGVHVNMCVLGRPFGLRQMARNGKNVVLMRDMTDTMYNPARWPYVSHFASNDLIVAHIEKFVCPTITSDQLIGGESFRFKDDGRADVTIAADVEPSKPDWSLTTVPAKRDKDSPRPSDDDDGVVWYRCTFRPGDRWLAKGGLTLQVVGLSEGVQAWFNGHELKPWALVGFGIHADWIERNDANLIVLRLEKGQSYRLNLAPRVVSGNRSFALKGTWQFRIGDDPAWSNMPLPARYGASPDILFEP
jgi:nicotinamidase-related amidase